MSRQWAQKKSRSNSSMSVQKSSSWQRPFTDPVYDAPAPKQTPSVQAKRRNVDWSRVTVEVQTKQTSKPEPQTPNPSVENQLNSSQGSGSPLPDDVRAFMEPRFGADFSQVRVHTGSEAVQMNRDLNAQAFTHKQDVYFGAGKAPGKDALTAHELTHVVQQTGAVQTKHVSEQPTVQLKCSACEKEEAEVQRSPHVSAVSQPGIQKWSLFGDDEDKKESKDSSGGGILDWAKEKASAAVDTVTQTGSDSYDWAKEKGSAAVDTVTQAGSDAYDGAKEKGNDIADMLPDMSKIDLNSLLAQASQQVVEQTQQPKLPRLQEAQALLERADSILVSNITPGSVDPDLPPPTTGADTDRCAPLGTVQSMRVSLDGSRTNLATAVTAFKNAQRATKIACEQGEKICYGAVAVGALAPILAAGGPAGVAAILGACISCIGGAYPVQNAIRVEMETYDALLPAMESLKKSLANYQTAVLGNRHCPDYHEPINPMKGGKKPKKP